MLLGDCLELMKNIPDKTVDMVLCDLPYGTTQNKWDSIIDLPSLWEQYERLTKPNAAIVLTAQTPFDKILGCSNLRWLRYEWVWIKSRATGHLNANKMPMKSHENILVFYKNLPTYLPQNLRNKNTPTIRKGGKGNGNNYGKSDVNSFQLYENYPTSVLTYAVEKGFHPTQKPVALFEYLIKTYTNEGDTVLDNCAGSFTTAIAAINTFRNYICIEKDAHYFAKGQERVSTHLSDFLL